MRRVLELEHRSGESGWNVIVSSAGVCVRLLDRGAQGALVAVQLPVEQMLLPGLASRHVGVLSTVKVAALA